jgi:prepilin-type N-terminal cleavage/methylation domain-containing protein
MEMIKMISGTGEIAELTRNRAPHQSLRDGTGQARNLRGKLGMNAFTLVEMLVVLAIIAMLLSITIPFTAGFGKGLRIKTSARAIAGVLNVAKSNAVTLRKNYTVVFDVKKDQYWIEDADGKAYEKKHYLPSAVKFKVKDDEEADPVTFENDRVTFNASGGTEGPSGSVAITDKQGDSRTISVIGSTGKVSID